MDTTLIVVRDYDVLELQAEVEETIMKDGEQLKHLKKELESELKKTTMLRFNVHLLPAGFPPTE